MIGALDSRDAKPTSHPPVSAKVSERGIRSASDTSAAEFTRPTKRFSKLLRLLSDEPSYELLVEVANHDMDEKKYEKAIAGYERALAMREDARMLTDLGVCYRETGKPANALGAFERALKIDSNVWEAAYNRAVLLADEGRFEEARAIARELRSKYPGKSEVRSLDEALSRQP
ncbi:MAG TPA: tetratricopeptide repeat protein [Thermoanaerobaculia bacterium]|nr:tetratricopeptide repeat protein [Thermoanaerobaculia bacterium]